MPILNNTHDDNCSNITKGEYQTKYAKENLFRIAIDARKDEKDDFLSYCAKFDESPTNHIKQLINEDATKMGLSPIFEITTKTNQRKRTTRK